ncbi:MAG: transcription-repair coupling factor, partial [Firmicutes bacterium]|nr:transcription-repair coupling factor [Bacillota bacterium]
EYIQLSAKRQLAQGHEFGPDTTWQREFEDAFPYQETDDQLRCAEEIKKDMQRPVPMDRLLCGDVGYGKTEVAARAIFKCLEEGKQAAVLVPTTILANQHYNTFKDRFAGYPFNVEMLSRFRTDKQQDEIVKKIKTGEVDLVVGTHRLLSADVEFKDLGLLVIDEEQRFGVEHKEAIKMLRENVDVLTLSATPIPRTLHMSLIGVRDMSVIEEPPEDRYPVQTYVMEQDDELIADAVKRELGRGGQVYVVYNRVRGINRVADKIEELVPEARVAAAHGQMGEKQLEDVMMDFTSGRFDVLVSTTIIESGLDIPNVNTLIVLDADRFGLSQLYQLRGRVGRSSRMAYAYLFYKKDKVLTEIAEKRLRAIKEFTEFGSGFRVAMRDLELRGAGNILGVEQSGHMLSIGYELYCRLVEEAAAELKGQKPEDAPIKADTQVELGVSAYIPEKYISDELTRLAMYKRISAVSSEEDRLEAEGELIDRFGDPPAEAENLLDVALIRNIASSMGVQRVV